MELREKVAAERRRLREVRQALSAAVAQGAQGAASWVDFYIAIGNYFAAAMHRLHVQDVRMGDLLREKADLTTPEAIQAMQELKDRLDGNQTHLEHFMACHAALQTEGAAALPAFESAARAYTDYIVANMGHHDGTTSLARAAFSVADWDYMAVTSDADAEREERLYKKVFAKLPRELNLPES
jgi:hypothetical protein